MGAVQTIALLALKWILVIAFFAGGTEALLFALPVVGLAGSSYTLLIIAQIVLDLRILAALFQKHRRALTVWIAVSFILTFASSYIEIGLNGVLMERSQSGNAFQDAFSDQLSMYGAIGPDMLVGMLVGPVWLIVDAIWHIMLWLTAIRHASR